jgi:hypothetical protein
MSKLIIHETDHHGCGVIYYKGKEFYYSYDDGCWGDVHSTIVNLIDIGFIDSKDVLIFDSHNSIYSYLANLMNSEPEEM